VWIRSEVRQTERRAPIVPADAGWLTSQGLVLTVEESPHRTFPVSDYAAAGCRIAPAGSWPGAPTGEYIIGLKELPEQPAALAHRHIYFGHAYKGQRGACQLLHRFAAGGGALLDLESLVDANGRRLAAFGFWAGYAGAALAILHAKGRLPGPLRPVSKEALDAALRATRDGSQPRVLVVGALGRCGRGARSALELAGITPTCWDIEETRYLDTAALLGHDILVNAILATDPVSPLMRRADLDDAARRLTLVADITCDVTSDFNALPIYDAATSWRQPVRRLRDGSQPLDIIAIDNLPSLVPREASADFSAQLAPHLMELGSAAPAWRRCLHSFAEALQSTTVD